MQTPDGAENSVDGSLVLIRDEFEIIPLRLNSRATREQKKNSTPNPDRNALSPRKFTRRLASRGIDRPP
jgi:hypothetical protein